MQTRTMKYQTSDKKNAENLGDIEGLDLFFRKFVNVDLKKSNKNKFRYVDLKNGRDFMKIKVNRKINDFEQ